MCVSSITIRSLLYSTLALYNPVNLREKPSRTAQKPEKQHQHQSPPVLYVSGRLGVLEGEEGKTIVTPWRRGDEGFLGGERGDSQICESAKHA